MRHNLRLNLDLANEPPVFRFRFAIAAVCEIDKTFPVANDHFTTPGLYEPTPLNHLQGDRDTGAPPAFSIKWKMAFASPGRGSLN